jgi:DNA-binding MarR family transcriptional regulator
MENFRWDNIEMSRNAGGDFVDRVLAQWKRERPDLDVSPIAIIGRISRVERMIDERMKAACAEFNLERWGFDVLAALRRAGEPFELTPTQLCKSLLLTSGAMTNRVDRLEAAGLVERLHCPADRRGVLVALTKDGIKVVDKALAAHMKIEESMLASLSLKDRGRFADLLRILSQDLESVGRG